MWLDRDGVYVLKKIKEFDMPTRVTTLHTDTKNLLDGLSILQVRNTRNTIDKE